jgi:hypothetical protein
MSDAQTQYIKCTGCGHPITVEYDVGGVPREERTLPPWACPHGCGCTERPTLLGRIVAAWTGHRPKPARRKT